MGREEWNLLNKKKMASMVAIVAIAAMLVSSALTMYTAEAKSKSKNKIHVGLGDARSFDGKVKLKLTNEDTNKVLLKETIDLKKLQKRSDCCQVTFSFDPKNSHKGDELRVLISDGGGSWESAGEVFKKGTINFSVDLDEIGE